MLKGLGLLMVCVMAPGAQIDVELVFLKMWAVVGIE